MQFYLLLKNISGYLNQFEEVFEYFKDVRKYDGHVTYPLLTFRLKNIDILNYSRTTSNYPIFSHNIVFYLTDPATRSESCFVMTKDNKVLRRIRIHNVIYYIDYQPINGVVGLYECVNEKAKLRDPLFERPTSCTFNLIT